MKITILGAGAWGTALAIHFANFHKVTLWGHEANHIAIIRQDRQNKQYLPDAPFPDSLNVTDNFSEAIAYADLILCATPIIGLRQALQNLKLNNKTEIPFLWACKGFEQQTGLLPHQILQQELPEHNCYGALSGPSFANELAKGLPCAVCLASHNERWVSELIKELNTPIMRLYANTDLTGVEVGGALKNIIAIATGVSDGLEYGLNARAALITRGLAEMTRLAVALGGKSETMMGLAGMGDLILTCTGSLSRNRTVGLLLSQNKSIKDILKELGHVAEGVFTAYEVNKLAREKQLDLPITKTVCQLLNNEILAQDAVENLMSRSPRFEG